MILCASASLRENPPLKIAKSQAGSSLFQVGKCQELQTRAETPRHGAA
jgi:hypothetical protein